MKNLPLLLIPALLILVPVTASADSWKDESGHGKGRGHGGREFKEEYYDGNCKVERELKKNGEYKEERKCKGPEQAYYEPARVYVPAPAVVQPGVTVNATIRIP